MLISGLSVISKHLKNARKTDPWVSKIWLSVIFFKNIRLILNHFIQLKGKVAVSSTKIHIFTVATHIYQGFPLASAATKWKPYQNYG